MTTFCLDYGFQTLQQIASCPNVSCRYFGPPADSGFLQRLGTSVPFSLDLALQNGPKWIIHRIRVGWIREPLCGRFEVRDSRFMRRSRVLLKGPWSATEMFVCPCLQSNLQNTFPIILRIYLDARFNENDWRSPICSSPKHYLASWWSSDDFNSSLNGLSSKPIVLRVYELLNCKNFLGNWPLSAKRSNSFAFSSLTCCCFGVRSWSFWIL